MGFQCFKVSELPIFVFEVLVFGVFKVFEFYILTSRCIFYWGCGVGVVMLVTVLVLEIA